MAVQTNRGQRDFNLLGGFDVCGHGANSDNEKKARRRGAAKDFDVQGADYSDW
jgi:hypothetical protein